MEEVSRVRSSALASLAQQGEQLRQNLRKPLSLESRRIALKRRIHLDFPHFKGFLTEYSSNISMTGMFVRSKKPEPPGTILAFEFRLADGFQLIDGTAEVIWVRERDESPDRPAGMGLRFVRLDKESRRLIRWAVEKQLREGGTAFELGETMPGRKASVTGGATENQAVSVGDLDLVHPGTEKEVDRARLHPYAGAAVARSRFGNRRVAAAISAVVLFAGALIYGLLRRNAGPGAGGGPSGEIQTEVGNPTAEVAGLPAPDEAIAPGESDRAVSEVLDTVAAWARAWSAQQVDDYLAFYAGAFRPPRGMTRDAWSEQRRDRITRPRRIEVRITELETVRLASERFRVSFHQHYESDSFADGVRKALELALEDGRWKIVTERSEP